MEAGPLAVRVVVLGEPGVGKTALAVQFLACKYVENYDSTAEDEYHLSLVLDCGPVRLTVHDTAEQGEIASRRYRDPNVGDWFLFLVRGQHRKDLLSQRDFASRTILQLRSLLNVRDYDRVPGFLVATMCDLPREVTRDEFIDMAIELGLQGYYETSAKAQLNVKELFLDATKHAMTRLPKSVRPTAIQTSKSSIVSALASLLPWNRKPKDNLYNLSELAAETSTRQSRSTTSYRFPAPDIKCLPMDYFDDMRQLLVTNEGRALSDVMLIGTEEGAVPIKAHKIVLCMRSEVLWKRLTATDERVVRIEQVSTAVLKHIVQFLYTEQLEASLPIELLAEIVAASRRLEIELVPTTESKHIAISDALRISFLDTEEMKLLSDVAITVEGKPFHLHRAMLWARSAWFRALIAERWKPGKGAIELTYMSTQVFVLVVCYLYTGYESYVGIANFYIDRRCVISKEIALDVLIAADMLHLPHLITLAESSLRSVVDASNAVPLFLAAEAHGAKQLGMLCKYWMAAELPESDKHEQWNQVSDEVKTSVRREHKRLLHERERRRESCRLLCLFVPDKVEAKPREKEQVQTYRKAKVLSLTLKEGM